MARQLEDEYCTVAEAARLLKVSHSTVWRWIDAERLPAYRVGPKNIRIKRSDLDQVIVPVKPGGADTSSMPEWRVERDAYTPRRLTDEEVERGLRIVAELEAEQEAQLARRGGVPFPESWEDIRQDREEQSARWR